MTGGTPGSPFETWELLSFFSLRLCKEMFEVGRMPSIRQEVSHKLWKDISTLL